MDRRAFVRSAIGLVAGASAGSPCSAFAQVRRSADTLFQNAVVLTMDPALPFAEAVAVRGGRILGVGDLATVQALCDGGTRVVDLAGACLSPGLIDAHSHLAAYGHMELYFTNVRPPRVHDFESLRAVLAEAADRRRPGEWLVARGFGEFDEERFPRRQEIDAATPVNPVLCIHWTGQYGIANTLALETAGILSASAKDPYGGKYLRDPRTGVPDGCLLHYPAIYSVHQPAMTTAESAEAAAWAVRRFTEQGVTCVHDNFSNAQSASTYLAMERSGALPLRVRVYPYVANLEHCEQTLARAPRYEGPLLRLQGVKLAVDGYPMMYEVPRQHQSVNMPMHPREQFNAIVRAVHRADLQVDVHAAGDLGVDWTLDAFSAAAGGDRQVRERRHRIEHFLFHRANSIGRAAEMGVPVCTQPAWIPVRGDDMLRRFGMAKTAHMVPLGAMRREGVATSYGADVPASPTPYALDSIRCAMARTTAAGVELAEEERVTFAQAFEAHTSGAAYAAFDEEDMGTIAAGKRADFAVWNLDLRSVDDSNIGQLEAVATYLGGKATWERRRRGE